MCRRNGWYRGPLALATMLALGITGLFAADEEKHSGPVRIGMVGSLFRDTPPALAMALMQPFGAMMESQTGLSGQLLPGGDALSLGQQLAEDRIHLAVFHGFEFAWARQKYPELRPLMIAVNQQRHLVAYVVVRKDSAAANMGDLKGKRLALPHGTREHCRLFLDRRCTEGGCDQAHYFGRVSTPANFEEALDDVVDRDADATIVDGVALECFQRRKPGRFTQLKTVQQSEVFPAGVVAYHPGPLDAESLQRFREGMINANKNPLGRQLMTLWKLTSFEAVPPDYEQTLQDIVKAYPAPSRPGK